MMEEDAELTQDDRQKGPKVIVPFGQYHNISLKFDILFNNATIGAQLEATSVGGPRRSILVLGPWRNSYAQKCILRIDVRTWGLKERRADEAVGLVLGVRGCEDAEACARSFTCQRCVKEGQRYVSNALDADKVNVGRVAGP